MLLQHRKLGAVLISNGTMLAAAPKPGMSGYGEIEGMTVAPGVMLESVAVTSLMVLAVRLESTTLSRLHSFGSTTPLPLPAVAINPAPAAGRSTKVRMTSLLLMPEL